MVGPQMKRQAVDMLKEERGLGVEGSPVKHTAVIETLRVFASA
jgi:hypothetical protein